METSVNGGAVTVDTLQIGGWDMKLDGDKTPELVEAPRGRRRVALVGFANPSRTLAPFEDPTVEIWGLNQLYRHMPRATRWFEMHRREMYLADQVEGTDYQAWLGACPAPVYMIDQPDDVRSAIAYPLERVVAFFGRHYLTSTPAMMLALACTMDFEEIALYGIDLVVGEEYVYQKPCMEWILGFMEGRARALGHGPRIVLQPTCALTKTLHRYGYDLEPDTGIIRSGMVAARIAILKEQGEDAINLLAQLDGALAECKEIRNGLGADCPPLVLERGRALEKRREDVYRTVAGLDGALQEATYMAGVIDLTLRGGTVSYGVKRAP